MTAAPRDAELALLAPVLELAVLVAQAGSRAVPRIDPPPLLRPYLGFSRRVPKPALRMARRVLDDDVALRDRLAPVVTEELVGEAGVLFVTRPPGWDERLGELVAAASEDVASSSSEKATRVLERRLAAAGEAAERLDAALGRTRAELEAVRAQLAEERRARVAADERVAALGAEQAALRAELRAAAALRDETAASLDAATARAAALQERLDELDAELVGRGSLDDALHAAISAVQQVHASLLLLRSEGRPPDAPAGPLPLLRHRAAGRGRPVRRRRHPIALPGGVLDDSADAANHLVRIPGVRVVVDGYNVAKLRWPTLGPSELRERLLAAVAAVAARTGARFHVVFDGDGAAASTAVQRRVGLRVTFTAKDVEADDAILALVEREPDGVPVVVVSNDRRVADGARERGAAALGVEAFFGTWSSA